MVVSESDMLSHGEENDDDFQQQQQKRSYGFSISSPIGRQSSIYSLTLDEFQHHTLSGKNFSSMNMDEFLNSIWTAEENQNQFTNNNANLSLSSSYGETEAISDHDRKGLVKQPSLLRQGSLTLPPPLSGKTVDEVWSEIHSQQQGRQNRSSNVETVNSAPKQQPTFGEMTLEDFLVKAGVVREQSTTPPPPPPPPPPLPQQYGGMYPSSRVPTTMLLGMGPAGGGGVKRNGDFGEQHVCYTGRMGNGGGFGVPVHESIRSPGSSDGIDISGLRGRKRAADGPVEKVVERRQKRMIKNRESAARSRARKQAYTIELEAELNQLREENVNLKQYLADLVMTRKQQEEHLEEMNMRPQTKARKAEEKLRKMRRASSCPL